MSELISVVAIIVEVVPNALEQQFDNAGFAVYDALVLRILQPDSHKDTLLTVYYSRSVQEECPLGKANTKLMFDIEEEYLAGKSFLFTAALRNLRSEHQR